MKLLSVLVCVLALHAAQAAVVTGRVMKVHGGDTVRLIVPGNAADFEEAVLISSRETSLAGRRAQVNTYVNRNSTRHVVVISYPDTGETKPYTFATIKLDGDATAGPDDRYGLTAQRYLAEKLEGRDVIVKPAEAQPAGVVRGTLRMCKGTHTENVNVNYQRTAKYRKAREAAAGTQPDTGYSYQMVDTMLADKPVAPLAGAATSKP